MKWSNMLQERKRQSWGAPLVWWVRRAEAEKKITEARRELKELRGKWSSDQRLLIGALRLLDRAGKAPTSAELIEAADIPNNSDQPRP